jgi:hypothetical protein
VAAHELGQKPLVYLGVDLQRPADRTTPGKWPHAENLVSTTDGAPEPRPGLGTSAVASAPANKTPWHSMRTLHDPTAGVGTWNRIHGIQDRLCDQRSGSPSTINDLLGGLSGNPLSMVQARPTESPQPFMYVADANLMRKVDRSGNLKQIGLPAPAAAPTALVSSGHVLRTVDLFAALTGWAAASGAAAPALLSAGPGRPVNTTTPATNGFVRDNASNLVCIAPTAMTNITVGTVLEILVPGPAIDNVLVEETHAGSAALAITRILYDSGTSGMCSIVLAASSPNIDTNSLLLVTGVASVGTELVRVHEVIYATDGSMCIRTSTSVERFATDTVEAKPSFTCHINGVGPSPGGTIQNNGLRTSVAAATTVGTPATISKVAALDLSSVGSTIGSALDDYMSILFRLSDQSKLTEIRLMLDCDTGSVSAGAFTGTEFTKNYFVKTITPSDLTSMLEFLQTALGNRQDQTHKAGLAATRRVPPERYRSDREEPGFNFPDVSDITDRPGFIRDDPPRDQLKSGRDQFSCVRFRLSEMQRVGTDETRGWKDIVGIRIAFITTAAVTLDVTGWILHGGYEPEIDELSEGYRYRVRGRDSSTGVVSNASPASLGPVRPLRQSVLVTLAQHPSAECDKLDVERMGGGVPGWRYVGTVANSASPTFTDAVSNESSAAALESDPSGLLHCQPWPLPQRPLTGSGVTVTVSGTLIRDTSAPWSTSLLRGSPVKANGRQGTLRRVLSTSLIEVEENMGQAASTTWEMPRPVLAGQPLPILFGGDWDQNRMIALGDPADPSAYYVTRRGNFDATYELLRYEIPGAILQNGCIYNGSPYIGSTEHIYRIEDAGTDPFGNLLLRAVVVPGSRGIIARYAFCSGDRMYGLDREGIWACDGGVPSVLTDDDLYPIFPHGGVAGVAVNGIDPPDLQPMDTSKLRLAVGGNRLRFTYTTIAGTYRELEYRIRTGAPSGWYPHVYGVGVASTYYDEGPGRRGWLMGGAGSPTAALYQLTAAQSDAGTAIAWSGTPQYENVGDPRKRKRWGDYTTEVDRDGSTVNVTPKFDNGLTAATLVALSAGTGRQIDIGNLGTAPVGSGVLATNMSLTFSGSVTTQRPRIYTWEPTWLNRPEVTSNRATDFEDVDPPGPKYVRGIWLMYDAMGNTRAVNVYRDGNLTTSVATVTGITGASGPKGAYFPFTTPFYAHTLLAVPTDASTWMLFGVRYEADAAPPSTTGPQELSDLGYAGAKWIQGVIVDADTEGATVSLRVEGDEFATLDTITGVVHTGRAQKCYTFERPLLTHLVRLNRLQACRLWPTPPTRWIWEPEPELAEHYETQQTTHDITEPYKISRDAQITLRSSTTVTFSIYDGSLGPLSTPIFTTTIASTAGLRKSVYVPLASIKWKSVIYVLDGGGTGFALYRRDSWVRVRGWGGTVSVLGGEAASTWAMVAPFGADSRINGALV